MPLNFKNTYTSDGGTLPGQNKYVMPNAYQKNNTKSAGSGTKPNLPSGLGFNSGITNNQVTSGKNKVETTPYNPPATKANTSGGGSYSASATDFGSGGGGTSTPGLYDDILKRLADAYNQRKLAQDAAYQQALKDQEYQDLLGRERNNSWLNTANRQVRNVMGNENSGLAKYSQARNQTNWMSKQADTQMAGNQVRANLNAQNMAKKADIEDAYAQTLYNLYNNQLSWEHYLKG